MKKLLLLLVLIGFVAVLYFFMPRDSQRMQSDISNRLTQVFDQKNIPDTVQAVVSGRDVTLTGNVDSEGIKTQAEQLAQGLNGVRAVKNDIAVMAQQELASIPAESEGAISDTGFTPTDLPRPLGLNVEAEMPPSIGAPIPDISMDTPVSEPPVVEKEQEQVVTTQQPQPAHEPIDLLAVPEEGTPETAAVAPVQEKTSVEPTQQGLADVTAELQTEIKEEVKEEVKGSEPTTVLPVIAETPTVHAASSIVETKQDVAVSCQSDVTKLMEGQTINFDSGSATISKSSHGLLKSLAETVKGCKDTVITILGYTDASGDVQANVTLSLNRAKSVGRHFISNGVRQEIRVVGNGPNDPIADNETPEGRAKNRRIEFKITAAQ